MDKKLYVLKNGEEPGISLDWLSFFAKIDGRQDVEYKIFVYKTELEDEDESVPYSMKWAFKMAKDYLAADSEDFEVKDDVAEDMLEWDDFYDDMDDMEAEEAGEVEPRDAEQEEAEVRETLHKFLYIEDELRMGSPWLDLILHLAGVDKPRISGNNYTGRFFVTSLYSLLMYLILDTDEVLDEVFERHQLLSIYPMNEIEKEEWYKCVRAHLTQAEEFKELEKRFRDNKISKLNIKELKHRNADYAGRVSLRSRPRSYSVMENFLESGQHTIVDLYQELVGNPAYRKELLEVAGTFENPDLSRKLEEDKMAVSLDELVAKTKDVSVALKSVLIGQDEAIEKLEKAFFHSEKTANVKRSAGPRSVYLFAGPPGVGKTYMAENFAKALGISYRRFDMSGYASINALDEIAGASSFFKNAKPGVLTEYVNNHSKSVLLFDEIEKAHSDVIRVFLQILDEGTCFDRYYDRNVSFKDCIIIMTTNAGRQLYVNAGNENLTEIADRVVIDALEKDVDPERKRPYFPPEIVSRMASHTIIMFNHLRADAIRRVIKNDIEKILKENKENYKFDISRGSDIVAATVQYSIGGGGDARNASRLAGKLIDKELYELFTLAKEKHDGQKSERLAQVSWECDFEDCSEEIRQFYLGEKDCVVPILKAADKDYEIAISKMLQVKVVSDIDAFMEIVRNEKVLFAVIDYAYGLKKLESSMSIADARTSGGKAFAELKEENPDIPVFILKNDAHYLYSESERRTLLKRGAEDFIDEDSLAKQLTRAYADICCKNAMELLKLRHQVLTYATRKEINGTGTAAKIIFYNLKLEMAVEAEDKDCLISDELLPDKKWEDVFVSDDVRDELEFFVRYLKNPREYMRTGARVPRGALMYGPPGTGKTSLAKVVASESRVNFLSVGADELLNGGSAKVHNIFQVARKYAPAVLFIDEIDAIGVTRKVTGANAVLNAILTEMDGFKRVDAKPVFVMAATNLKGIDAALARRFDRTFVVDLPEEKGRRWILKRLLKVHADRFCISEKEIESIVVRSGGLSPADLENIIETALREGIRSGTIIEDELLDEIFERCNFGEKRERSSEKEMEHTAYHEAGHALIELYYGRSPEYMSVIARGNFGGYVQSEKLGEHPTKERLLQRICTSLGGRAAELEFGYGLTPGAASDLATSTKLATQMVCEYGMYEEEIGLAVITEEEYKSDERAKALVNRILKEQLNMARTIINENRDAVTRLVKAVLKNEQKYLTKKDIMDAYRGI